MDPHDISFEDENPLCGDQIKIDLRVDESGKITEAAFDGHGCAISQASADLLLESIIGKSIEEIKKLTKSDILEMLGIELGPVTTKMCTTSFENPEGRDLRIGRSNRRPGGRGVED